MNIVLFAPEIPQNAGNIARTCAVTGASLTLIRPLGFNITDKRLKRPGLDYWKNVNFQILDDLEEMLVYPFYFFSTHGKKNYSDISFSRESTLIFGSETSGLPKWIHERWSDCFFRIPMKENARSLNLSNAVAIVLYEALRQQNFNFPDSPQL